MQNESNQMNQSSKSTDPNWLKEIDQNYMNQNKLVKMNESEVHTKINLDDN